MNQRLSIQQNIFSKIFLAFGIWLVLSLPSPIGIFEYLLIRSHIVFLVLLQRAIHYGICLYALIYFLRDKIVIEYNETELIILNKMEGSELRLPFSRITKLSLIPKYLSFTMNQSFNYELYFLDENGLEESLKFRANPGRKMAAFIALVEKNNPEFVFKNQTFY